MPNHEDYTNWKPQPPIGKAGIQTETFYSDSSRTVVESPIVKMQAGLPAQIPVIRPKRIVNPHFILNDDFENLESDDLPILEAESSEGRFILEVMTSENEDNFTATEIDLLAAVALDGLQSDWQALDVWD